jgi:tRNA-splicing endonuclease subunit Sen2
MADTTQVDTASNGGAIKSQQIINEVSHKAEHIVNGDAIKTQMKNVNGGAQELKASIDLAAGPKKGNGRARGPTKSQQLNKLYSLPAPLRTFPLPTFVPHNPISLFQVLYVWLQQTINPPSSHPQVLYQGLFSPELRSVHISDQRSIRALWQEGFYGKGSLSRSEPSWLDREKRRIGANASKTSEEVTRQRRAERQQVKWERARLQQEAIDQKRREEMELAAVASAVLSDGTAPPIAKVIRPPTGPEQLLSLPNSLKDLELSEGVISSSSSPETLIVAQQAGEELESLNGEVMKTAHTSMPVDSTLNGHVDSVEYQMPAVTEVDLLLRPLQPLVNTKIPDQTDTDASTNCTSSSANVVTETEESVKVISRKKSVRFSPTIEQQTFLQSEPVHSEPSTTDDSKADELPLTIQDQEHLQLTMEEAFFLNYGLGVLSIHDANTKQPILTKDLFSIFRQTSYFPPPAIPLNMPDDPFLISYVVYHHFRSLGWCVRGGTKFGVDYLLYNRGPVFSHAEFAVMILPSYSDPFWSSDAQTRAYVAKKQKRSWSWLHCVNRVNSQVKKTLILVYVDIPSPLAWEEEQGMGVDEVLKRYGVREIVLKRWLSNRSRD